VIEERGEGFLKSGTDALVVRAEFAPGTDLRIAWRQFGFRRYDAERELTFEAALPHDVPTVVVAAPVFFEVLGRGLVGRVGCTEGW